MDKKMGHRIEKRKIIGGKTKWREKVREILAVQKHVSFFFLFLNDTNEMSNLG